MTHIPPIQKYLIDGWVYFLETPPVDVASINLVDEPLVLEEDKCFEVFCAPAATTHYPYIECHRNQIIRTLGA